MGFKNIYRKVGGEMRFMFNALKGAIKIQRTQTGRQPAIERVLDELKLDEETKNLLKDDLARKILREIAEGGNYCARSISFALAKPSKVVREYLSELEKNNFIEAVPFEEDPLYPYFKLYAPKENAYIFLYALRAYPDMLLTKVIKTLKL